MTVHNIVQDRTGIFYKLVTYDGALQRQNECPRRKESDEYAPAKATENRNVMKTNVYKSFKSRNVTLYQNER